MKPGIFCSRDKCQRAIYMKMEVTFMEKTSKNYQIAMGVSRNTIIVNVVLSVFKLFAGVIAHSAAMISDSVHSISDVLSTAVVMVGVKMAGKQSDKDHPYGHERFECVAAIILSVLLFLTGLGIGYSGIKKLMLGDYSSLAVPGGFALAAAAISIFSKEIMYWYTRSAAKTIGSGALMADAWHHRSDALSSVGSFVGILGARMGFPVLDVIACLVICVFIVKVSVEIFADAIGKMTDKSCDDDTVAEICSLVLEQEDVLEIDQLKTRLFGDKIYVDIEISADGNASLYETHEIAHNVHDTIEQRIPNVKHCMVHVNPMGMGIEHNIGLNSNKS